MGLARFNESSIRTAIEESLKIWQKNRFRPSTKRWSRCLAELSEADVEANRQTDAFHAYQCRCTGRSGDRLTRQFNRISICAGLAHLERGEPLTVDHVLHMASVGKQVTGLAIMMLSEEGMVRHDAPVGDYVPELAHWGPDVTLRSLLTHTSGLPDYDYFFDDLIDLSRPADQCRFARRVGRFTPNAQRARRFL